MIGCDPVDPGEFWGDFGPYSVGFSCWFSGVFTSRLGEVCRNRKEYFGLSSLCDSPLREVHRIHVGLLAVWRFGLHGCDRCIAFTKVADQLTLCS